MFGLFTLNIFYKHPMICFIIFWLCIGLSAVYLETELPGGQFFTIAMIMTGAFNLWKMAKLSVK